MDAVMEIRQGSGAPPIVALPILKIAVALSSQIEKLR